MTSPGGGRVINTGCLMQRATSTSVHSTKYPGLVPSRCMCATRALSWRLGRHPIEVHLRGKAVGRQVQGPVSALSCPEPACRPSCSAPHLDWVASPWSAQRVSWKPPLGEPNYRQYHSSSSPAELRKTAQDSILKESRWCDSFINGPRPTLPLLTATQYQTLSLSLSLRVFTRSSAYRRSS